MDKSDILSSVSAGAMAEVSQESRGGTQTQMSIHVEDIPPNIRNTAYEMAGAFFDQGKRTKQFRQVAKNFAELTGGNPMTAETFAIVSWPQFVNIAIECLTECLNWPGIPTSEKDVIVDELVAFNANLDARAASAVRLKKINEPLN